MRKNNRGFTLVEILAATAIFAIIMVGILNLLDTSTRLSKLETALSDTQENVRFAAYHLMRTTRMMGGAVLPFAADIGGNTWVMGQLLSNQSGTVTTPFGDVEVLNGSDVLTVRGFFEISPFFVNRTDIITTGTDRVEVRESSGGAVINNVDRYSGAANLFEGRGIVFMGNMDQAQYAVGEVAAGSTLAGASPDRILSINFIDGAARWSDLSPTGATIPPAFNTYRVGILESYTYYVRPDFTLMRLRADSSGDTATPQPVAVNIGGLQVSLGVDETNNGQIDFWRPAPVFAQIIDNRVLAIRITVLGRTPFPVAEWIEPVATFDNSGVHDMAIGVFDRSAKWRRIDVEAALRNYLL